MLDNNLTSVLNEMIAKQINHCIKLTYIMDALTKN